MQVWTHLSQSDLDLVVAQIVLALPSTGVVVFNGEMGAGKTTLIKRICKALGVESGVSSPTYSLVNTYMGSNEQLVHHMDLYRLRDFEELIEAGIEERFYEQAVVLIEWPQVAYSLLPRPFLCIELETMTDNERKVTMNLSNCLDQRF
jgi:tRNA threonylcarbamoyladenosine biosynthesis protein TsaE